MLLHTHECDCMIFVANAHDGMINLRGYAPSLFMVCDAKQKHKLHMYANRDHCHFLLVCSPTFSFSSYVQKLFQEKTDCL